MIGDAILQLPRYSIPVSHFQCYLGNIDPHYYYIALSGILVGLSVDPSFIPSQQPEDSGIIDECYLPAVRYYPQLLNFIPVCQNLGVGIIHSVDLKKNVVTILTPLETEQMREVWLSRWNDFIGEYIDSKYRTNSLSFFTECII